MSDEKFVELTNLYLDREISARDLEWLKQELAANPVRKREFEQRCRLHQAMHLALNPGENKVVRQPTSPRRRNSKKGTASSGARSVSAVSATSRRAVPARSAVRGASSRSPEGAPVARWVLGTGVAASFVVGFALLAPMLSDTLDQMTGLEPASFALSDEESAVELGESELQRYIQAQSRVSQPMHGSLAGHLRLLGLAPEMGPGSSELQGVDLAALKREMNASAERASLLQLQGFTPMPDPALLGTVAELEASVATPAWGSGFTTSLARFR